MNCLTVALETMPRLLIPPYMLEYYQEYIEKFSNGCGDKWTAWIVPETILGMSIKIACIIHDLEYQFVIDYMNSLVPQAWSKGEIKAVIKNMKIKADLRFKQNIEILADSEFQIEKNGTWSLFFWQSEIKQARRKKRIRYSIADNIHYELISAFGKNSIESELKLGLL